MSGRRQGEQEGLTLNHQLLPSDTTEPEKPLPSKNIKMLERIKSFHSMFELVAEERSESPRVPRRPCWVLKGHGARGLTQPGPPRGREGESVCVCVT